MVVGCWLLLLLWWWWSSSSLLLLFFQQLLLPRHGCRTGWPWHGEEALGPMQVDLGMALFPGLPHRKYLFPTPGFFIGTWSTLMLKYVCWILREIVDVKISNISIYLTDVEIVDFTWCFIYWRLLLGHWRDWHPLCSLHILVGTWSGRCSYSLSFLQPDTEYEIQIDSRWQRLGDSFWMSLSCHNKWEKHEDTILTTFVGDLLPQPLLVQEHDSILYFDHVKYVITVIYM